MLHGCLLLSLVLVVAAPWLSAGPRQATARELSVVVQRGSDSIEFFLAGNTLDVITAFHASPSLFVDYEDHVDFDAFLDGTWVLAQTILNGASVGGDVSPLDFQAMSLMLHPNDGDPVPFRDVFDAVDAVSICSVAEPADDLALQQTDLFAGYIAYTNHPLQAFRFDLPVPGTNGSFEVFVQDYDTEGRVKRYRVTVDGSGALLISSFSHQPVRNFTMLLQPWAFFDALIWLPLVVGFLGCSVTVFQALRKTEEVR